MANVLFDLDGVIRIYPMEESHRIEQKYGLPKGLIYKIALESEILKKVTTGVIRRKDWITYIGENIGSMDAALEWNTRKIILDCNIIRLVDSIRDKGHFVHLITNGTDNLRNELSDLGVASSFDNVYNSAEIGSAKPDATIFNYVLNDLDCHATSCLFIDDSKENISTANKMGFISFHYDNSDSRKLSAWIKSNIFI